MLIDSIESIIDQYEINIPIAAWGKNIYGKVDVLIQTKAGDYVVYDIKYSDFDYGKYNINRDMQLHIYLKSLKAVLKKPITIGFMTPKDGDMFHICDNTELLSQETASRVKYAYEGMKAQIWLPACGGGAYQSVNKLCDLKCHCNFASGMLE